MAGPDRAHGERASCGTAKRNMRNLLRNMKLCRALLHLKGRKGVFGIRYSVFGTQDKERNTEHGTLNTAKQTRRDDDEGFFFIGLLLRRCPAVEIS